MNAMQYLYITAVYADGKIAKEEFVAEVMSVEHARQLLRPIIMNRPKFIQRYNTRLSFKKD